MALITGRLRRRKVGLAEDPSSPPRPGMPVELRPGVTLEVPTEADQVQMTQFLDAELRSGSRYSIVEDLPLLVGPGARSYRRIIRDSGRVVAHAALYVHAYRLLDYAFNVGVIGAVATASDRRGLGLGTTLIRELVSILADQEVDVTVLWSEAPGWYERFGFISAGRETIHVAQVSELPVLPDGLVVREAVHSDLSAVMAIHNQEPALPIRTAQEWWTCMDIPGTGFYVMEETGVVTSYGVVGKGQDLQGCLHEWGGPEHHLPHLVTGILAKRETEELYVMSAPWKNQAAKAMRACGAEEIQGVLGMVRITDPTAFCRRINIHHLETSVINDHASLVPAIFGHKDISPVGMRTPLPFYLFGLDSM